jgi:alpha-amylase
MLRLLFVIHNHQPVGNFDAVVRKATRLSYRPFLEEMKRFPGIPFGLHVSGPLLEWMEANDPAVIDLIASGVEEDRIEIVGGGFGEPILPMIPHRDRIGQIRALGRWIEARFGTRPRGAWLSERVWEAGLASALAEAGVEYTFLDDSHFLAAGHDEADLRGAFVVEDGGRVIRVFPISEQLRYDIPFATVDTVIGRLRKAGSAEGTPLLCYADDGEKFGIWPETHDHVYERGWLRRFLSALEAAADEVRVITPAQAVDDLPPAGRTYLPDASYREMNEWTLPLAGRERYEEAARELESTRPRREARALLRGGVWRNFLVHYPEANHMVSRMLRASARVAALPDSTAGEARLELYRGQCNCAYWHGIFGGLYLPHLRTAIYRHLLRADRLADPDAPPVRAEVIDHDRDGRMDVVLETPDLSAVIAPGRGGHLADLCARDLGVNLLNVLARIPEYEHEEILNAPDAEQDDVVKTIHDAVVEDAAAYLEHIVFDDPGLEGLIDRFAEGDDANVGGFASGAYGIEEVDEGDDRVSVRMTRGAGGLRVEKTIALAAGSRTLEVGYRIATETGRPRRVRFTVELSAGIPGGDTFGRRYVIDGRDVEGNLSAVLRRGDVTSVDVIDDPVGVSLALRTPVPARLEADPVFTVSRSEAGFERIFQAARLHLAWDLDLVPGESRETRLDLVTSVR